MQRSLVNKMIDSYNMYVKMNEKLWRGKKEVPITTYLPMVD